MRPSQIICATFLVAALLTATASAQDSPASRPSGADEPNVETKTPSAHDVAIAYFEALTQADLEKVKSVVAVPFSPGGTETVKTEEELAAKHKEIIAQKGKREVPAYTVSIAEDPKGLDRAIFPTWEAIRISITNTAYRLDIYVIPGDSPKVIGWSNSNRK